MKWDKHFFTTFFIYQHAESKQPCFVGIDGVNGVLADMTELGILDPLAVKMQTIKTAIESASMLLRIDDVVSGMADKKTASGSSNFQEDPDFDKEDGTVRCVFFLLLLFLINFLHLVWRRSRRLIKYFTLTR